jgi:hypothetical protein
MHANVAAASLREVLTIFDRVPATLTIPTNSPSICILPIKRKSTDESVCSINFSEDPRCDVKQTANVHVAACSLKVLEGNAK